MRILLISFIVCLVASGCGIGKSTVSNTKKYSPEQLQKDYSIYQDILEKHHPGLYWYTPKDSMDYYFNWGKERIKDSLTEPQFRQVVRRWFSPLR